MYKHISLLFLSWPTCCILGNEIEFDDSLYQQHFKNKSEILDYLSGKTLKTKRLSISFTTEDDIDHLAPYFIDEEYLRGYDMSSVWPKDIEEAKEHLKEFNIQYKKKYYFTIKIRETNTCIGQLGVDFTTPKKLWISYWLAEPYQKNGYMFEICSPMIKYFFDTCEEFSMLHIRANSDNISSQKLAKKICAFINKDNKYRYDTYCKTIKHFSKAFAKDIRYEVVHFKLFKDKL